MPPSPGDPIPSWLKSLPVAPEFRPTAAEFADPVAYILKIEPAAAPFGICKVVPPHPPPPKRTTLANLTRSFAALHPDNPSPTFPSRHQQLGLCPRRPRPAIKPVWQSSHRYTLPQFEAKAGATRKALLSHLNVPASRQLSPLDVEALFWCAMADRPVTVEYASDMAGSGFAPCAARPRAPAAAHGSVGDTAWNMRGVARSPGSLLRFLREDVPGVTSPMLYVAMMFSWFAWHVEDHDLHSVNYMHSGAPKTWYGVPGDAALAFEDVVRVHGYGGELNSLETFAMLGNKTTVMSPEVLVELGIPCCRLVQNAGEFVITFPGAYHTGFSHGFNCGEASNIATPEWLRVAKEAAVRRASINRPPMVSHYQLLYELAMSMCLRELPCGAMEPRSSRLKEKKKCDGEQLVKRIFVRNVIEDNKLLSLFVNDGSSCIILPTNDHDGPIQSNLFAKSQWITESRVLGSTCTNEEDSGSLPLTGACGKNIELGNCGVPSAKGNPSSVCPGKKYPPATCMNDCVNMSSSSEAHNAETDMGDVISAAGLLDQGLLSCVTCGILSFSCVAVIKPREPAAKFLMTADCSLINNQLVGSGGSNLEDAFRSGGTGTNGSILPPLNRNSALDLLASAYGDHSDPDKDVPNKKLKVSNDSNKLLSPRAESQCNTSSVGAFDGTEVSTSSKECQQGSFSQSSQCASKPSIPNGPKGVRTRNKYKLKLMLSEGFPAKDIYSATQKKVHFEPPSSNNASTEPIPDTNFDASHNIKDSSTEPFSVAGNRSSTVTDDLFIPIVKPDKDSSRMHVFCLEHAAEVEKQLQTIGGAHVVLLCRPEYPKVEAEARLLAEEMEFDYDWKDIHFREASMEDRKKIQEVVQDEETIPTNSDWAVKLGINLYYSANLAKSPLYKKQLPYNRVIYKAFGCSSPDNSPVKLKTYARRQGRQKKVVLAGRWCGKVWMSNQVHPYLAHRTESHEPEEADEICSYQLDQKTKGEPVDNSSREAASTGKRAVEEKSSKREQEPLEKLNPKKPKLDQKTKGEPVDNSSREAASTGKRAVEEKSSKREQQPLEKLNSKKPKLNEEDSSKGLEGAAEVSTINSGSRTVVEKANTKKPEHTEEDNSKALKGAAEASCLIPTEVVLRSSTRIANRKDKLKSKMKEEDNDPASALQPMVKEDNDGPASLLRARSPTQKAKVDMKKQLKRTRGKEQRTPSATDLKDEEQQPSDAKGCLTSSDTKHQLSVRKQETKVGATQETKRAKRRAPSPPEHVEEYKCDIEGCSMSFGTNQELSLHKRDICPVKGCRKKFFSHKYLLQHRKVHADDRPLKCPWKDCKRTFKWQWARTEHVRVHTGDRPYVCHEPGCEQTFRFVSDFSRHKRRTGHLDKAAKTK